MLCGSHMGFGGHGMKFMTVEEEIEMLEGAKTRLETQLKNIDERLKKLKAWFLRKHFINYRQNGQNFIIKNLLF